MTEIEPSQNARAMFANILRQLGCSDEDIFKLIGNYRGVISIPISYLKNKKQKWKIIKIYLENYEYITY